MLVAVFLLSYLVAFFAISLTPYGVVTERVYSNPQTQSSNDPSAMGGAFLGNQLLYLIPGAGATNVSRDTAVWIEEPRPVRIEKISLSPEVPIAISDEHVSFPPSATIAIYPAELLQPDTTYNVSAIVAGTPSWWIFTTASEPTQPTFSTHLASYDTWVAFTAAILVTLTVILVIFFRMRKQPLTHA